jgi:hypothetical protein
MSNAFLLSASPCVVEEIAKLLFPTTGKLSAGLPIDKFRAACAQMLMHAGAACGIYIYICIYYACYKKAAKQLSLANTIFA